MFANQINKSLVRIDSFCKIRMCFAYFSIFHSHFHFHFHFPISVSVFLQLWSFLDSVSIDVVLVVVIVVVCLALVVDWFYGLLMFCATKCVQQLMFFPMLPVAAPWTPLDFMEQYVYEHRWCTLMMMLSKPFWCVSILLLLITLLEWPDGCPVRPSVHPPVRLSDNLSACKLAGV